MSEGLGLELRGALGRFRAATTALMERKFNTAGPCIEGDHGMLEPLQRLRADEVVELIDDKRCFVLHAPRQTGKTTCLLALMKLLNEGGRYRALYANIEAAQAVRGSVDRGLAIVCKDVADAGVVYLGDDAPWRTAARATDACPSRWSATALHASG